MPYYINLPDGRSLEFDDDFPREQAMVKAREVYMAPPEGAPQQEDASISPIRDTAASVVSGLGGIGTGLGGIAGLLTGNYDNLLSRGGRGLQEYARENIASEGLRQRQDAFSRRLEGVENEGILSQAGTAASALLSDPYLAASMLVEQVPQVAASLGVGRAGMAVGQIAGRRAGAAAGSEAMEQAARRGALTGAIGTGTALQTGEVAEQTYKDVMDLPAETIERSPEYARLRQTMSPEEAREALAVRASREAAAIAAPLSAATASLLPGVERMAFGQQARSTALRRVLTGFTGEGVQEGIEEGGGRFAQNVGARGADTERDLTQGVGSSAATGAILGGVIGGATGVASGQAPEPRRADDLPPDLRSAVRDYVDARDPEEPGTPLLPNERPSIDTPVGFLTRSQLLRYMDRRMPELVEEYPGLASWMAASDENEKIAIFRDILADEERERTEGGYRRAMANSPETQEAFRQAQMQRLYGRTPPSLDVLRRDLANAEQQVQQLLSAREEAQKKLSQIEGSPTVSAVAREAAQAEITQLDQLIAGREQIRRDLSNAMPTFERENIARQNMNADARSAFDVAEARRGRAQEGGEGIEVPSGSRVPDTIPQQRDDARAGAPQISGVRYVLNPQYRNGKLDGGEPVVDVLPSDEFGKVLAYVERKRGNITETVPVETTMDKLVQIEVRESARMTQEAAGARVGPEQVAGARGRAVDPRGVDLNPRRMVDRQDVPEGEFSARTMGDIIGRRAAPAGDPKIAADQRQAKRIAAQNRLNELYLDKLKKGGAQGRLIRNGLVNALKDRTLNADQVYAAFIAAEQMSRLMPAGANHQIQFLKEILPSQKEAEAITKSGGDPTKGAAGRRVAPQSAASTGIIQLSLAPQHMGIVRDTAAHEAFHVLQDYYSRYDPKFAQLMAQGFKDKMVIADVDPTIRRKLQQAMLPGGKRSFWDALVADLGDKPLSAREAQAYAFGALHDASKRGVPMTGLKPAFARFVNFLRQFFQRMGNALRGDGFTDVASLMEGVSRGDARRFDDRATPTQQDFPKEAKPSSGARQVEFSARGTDNDEDVVMTRTVLDIQKNIGAERLVSGERSSDGKMRTVGGGDFLDENIAKNGAGMPRSERRKGEAQEDHEKRDRAAFQATITKSWEDAIAQTRGGRETIDRLASRGKNMRPRPAEFWDAALKLPDRARYWYEVSAEAFQRLLPSLSPSDLSKFIDVVAATSPQANPYVNLTRALGALSEWVQKRPIETDLTTPGLVAQALGDAGLTGPKIRSFGGTMKYLLGLSDERPLSTNDRQVASSFYVTGEDIAANPALYEVLSRFYLNLRDGLNDSLPKGAQPYETWQLQALGWVEERALRQDAEARSEDDYEMALRAITSRLESAGIPAASQGLTDAVLRDRRLPNALSGTREEFTHSPIATMEIQSVLTRRGPDIDKALQAAKELADAKSIAEFEAITKRAFSAFGRRNPRFGGASLAETLASALADKSVGITRVEQGWGTFEGAAGMNLRVPLGGLNAEQRGVFLAIVGNAWNQAAMAASSFAPSEAEAAPASGRFRTYTVFLEGATEPSFEQIADFSRGMDSMPMSVKMVPNGVVVDINPVTDAGPKHLTDKASIHALAERVFGARAKLLAKDWESDYIDRSDYKKVRDGYLRKLKAEYAADLARRLDIDIKLAARALDANVGRSDADRGGSAGAGLVGGDNGNLPGLNKAKQAALEKVRGWYKARVNAIATAEREAANVFTKYEDELADVWVPRVEMRAERARKQKEKANARRGEGGAEFSARQTDAASAAEGRLRDGRGLRGSQGLVAAPRGAGDVDQEPLEGLPSRVKAPGIGVIEAGPFLPARRVAAQYMREAGLPYNPPKVYARVDPKRAARIADAFEAMADNPNDPLVRASYEAMARETMAQWEAIKRTGFQAEFYPEDGSDPYPGNPRLAIEDVRNNNHMYVYSTEAGYGQAGITDEMRRTNPMLADTGERWNGRPVLVNDVFRAVHDYFGHAKEGVGFRADGEENAWRSHASMYSPLARLAMTAETRGQNSWLNYGPRGDANRNAKVEDTVFADQKLGVLPSWVHSEGAEDFLDAVDVDALRRQVSSDRSGDDLDGMIGNVEFSARQGDRITDVEVINASPITKLDGSRARGYELVADLASGGYLMVTIAVSGEEAEIVSVYARGISKNPNRFNTSGYGVYSEGVRLGTAGTRDLMRRVREVLRPAHPRITTIKASRVTGARMNEARSRGKEDDASLLSFEMQGEFSARGNPRGEFSSDPDLAAVEEAITGKPLAQPGVFQSALRKFVGGIDRTNLRGETKAEGTLDAFVRTTVNRAAPLWLLDRLNAEKGISLRSAGVAMEVALNNTGRIQMFMQYGPLAYDPVTGDVTVREDVPGALRAFKDRLKAKDARKGQTYLALLKERDLRGVGRKGFFNLTDAQVNSSIAAYERDFPDWRDMAADMQKINEALLDFAVATGQMDRDKANELAQLFYTPFYRLMDEDAQSKPDQVVGPRISDGMTKLKTAFDTRLEGGESPLGDLFENIIRNADAIMKAGLKNVAMITAAENMEAAGLGRIVDKQEAGKTISFRVEGKTYHFQVDDPVLFSALASAPRPVATGIFKAMQSMAGFFRDMVTAAPSFMIANLWRGKLMAYAQEGASLNPLSTVTGLRDALKASSSYKAIAAQTGFSAGSWGMGGEDSAQSMKDALYGTGYMPRGLFEKFMRPLRKASEATEMAERIALYEKLKGQGLTDKQAAFQAYALAPFSRRGMGGGVLGDLITRLVPYVPFLNAKIQGMYRLFENEKGSKRVLGVPKEIFLRGLVLMSASLALAGYNMDAEEERWDREPPDLKFRYDILYLPNERRILIPRPFEVGSWFGALPVFLVDAIRRKDGSDIGKLMADLGTSTFFFNPIPQALIPIAGAALNYDFFRARALEDRGIQSFPAGERANRSTSEIAKIIGRETGISPIRIQYILEGYSGTIGTNILAAFDSSLAAMGAIPNKPAGAFGDPMSMPGIIAGLTGASRFYRADDQTASRYIGDFYKIKEQTDQLTRSLNRATQIGDVARIRELQGEEGLPLRLRPVVNAASRQLDQINARIRQIENRGLSSEDLADSLRPLRQQRDQITQRVVQMARAAGI